MKQVVKTAQIIERLRGAFGAEVDVEDMAVFEVIALNNLPLRKKHPLYEGAVAQDSLLRDLSARINEESAPLHVMHRTGTLPFGRVFDAKLNGQEVRALVALSKKTQADLIADMDQGIIDQVSVNVLPKQILCSDCGWDYLGEDSGIENIYLGHCGNDHVLRQDGVHAKLHGLDLLAEVSLVNSGGAQNARIQARDQQVYAAPEFQRLAASGHSPALLIADLTPDTQQEEVPNMDLTALTASLTDEKAKVITLTAQLETANTTTAAAVAQVTELTASLEAANAELKELKDNPPETPPAVLAFLQDLCKRSLVACGEQTPTIPEKVDELVAKITEAQSKLSALIPPGGAALSTETDISGASTSFAPSAFRTAGA